MGFHVSDAESIEELEGMVLASYISWETRVSALEEIKQRVRLEGWVPFGTHTGCRGECETQLEFSDELDECGLPEWERVVTDG